MVMSNTVSERMNAHRTVRAALGPSGRAVASVGGGNVSPGQAMAEGVGFEPTRGCPLHALQACRFGRSRIPPAEASGYREPAVAVPRSGRVLRNGIP